MSRTAAGVFGAIRFADEHWLTVPDLVARTGLSWRSVSGALRDLCRLGLVVRRREGRTPCFGLAGRER